MTALLRRATLLAAGAVLIAAEGMASVPNAANSTQPTPRVAKIGGRSNPGDYTGVVTYTIKDGTAGGGAAIENCPVTLSFGACGDLELCRNSADCPAFQEPSPNPPYDEPGCVDCTAKTVTGFTNASGVVTFVIVGSGTGGAAEIGPCITVTAGTSPSSVTLDMLVAAFADYNGVGGVNSVDLGVIGADILPTAAYVARSDFNADADCNAVDLGIWGAFQTPPGTLSPCSCDDPGDPCPELVSCPPGM